MTGYVCKKCRKPVLQHDKKCAHCGAPLVYLHRRNAIILLVIVLVGGAFLATRDKQPEPQTASCQSDWTKCSDNKDLVENFLSHVSASLSCKQEAAKQAKYGDPKFSWFPFGSYFKGDSYVRNGVAILIEDDAQYQNAFGAMAHTEVRCRYDLREKKVIYVELYGR